MKNFAQCAVIPIGVQAQDGKEWLFFSIYVTPLIADLDATAPIRGIFAKWPELTGLPAAPKLRTQRYLRWSEVVSGGLILNLNGTRNVPADEIYLDGTWWMEHQPPAKPSADWWAHCMRGIKMRQVADPASGASASVASARNVPAANAQVVPGVAVPEAAAPEMAVAPVHQAVDLRTSLQQGQSTAEGLSSDELNREVVAPLMRSHALGIAFEPEDEERFRGAREALRRLDRAGSAGRSSLRESEDETELREEGQHTNTTPAPNVRGMTEFLEFISSLSDHPSLLRHFGLLFDIRVPRASFPEAAAGQAKFEVSASLTTNPSWNTGETSGDEGRLQPLQPVRATRCWLHEMDGVNLFTPAPTDNPKNTLAIANGVFAQAYKDNEELIGTVQADLVAGLRAAVAERERTSKSGQTLETRRRLSLLNHGIAAYLKDSDPQTGKAVGKTKNAMTESLNRLGKKWYEDKAEERVLTAEDLLRGVVVEVSSQVKEGGTWSDWQSLNWRRNLFQIVEPGKTQANSARPLDEWTVKCAEGPLALELSEARQPLSGWLLGPLWLPANGTDPPRAVRLRLDDSDWEALDAKERPDPYHRDEEYPCYLLATAFGLIVILDGPKPQPQQPPVKWQPDPPKKVPRALGDLVEMHLRQHDKFRFGQWIELTGFIHRQKDKSPGGYFVATGAQLAPENVAGLAGTVVHTTPEKNFLRMEILRWQVEHVDAEPTIAPTGQVFVEYESDESHAAATATAEGKVEEELKKIDLWRDKQTEVAPKRDMFFTGRGLPTVVASEESSGNQLSFADNGRPRLRLRSYVSSGVSAFEIPDLPSGTQAAPVLIDLGTDLNLRTVLGAKDPLPVGAVYQIELEPDAKAKSVKVKRITEEITPEEVEIEAISFNNKKWTLKLKIHSGSIDVTVTGETVVALLEAVPKQVVSSTPTPKPERDEGFTADDEMASEQESRGFAVRTLGPWSQHGLRVAPGDRCRATLDPTSPSILRRLEIIRHDPERVLLGRISPDDQNEETSFQLGPLGVVGGEKPIKFQVDDDTVIIAPPAAPGLAWRTVQAPPSDGLVKVILDKEGSHAERVEILSSLRGRARIYGGSGPGEAFLASPILNGHSSIVLLTSLRRALVGWLPDKPIPKVILPGTPAMEATNVAAAVATAGEERLPGAAATFVRFRGLLRALQIALSKGLWSLQFGEQRYTTDQAVSLALQELEQSERPSLRLRLPVLQKDLVLALPLGLVDSKDRELFQHGICEVALITRPRVVNGVTESREMVARISLEVEAIVTKGEPGRWFVTLESGNSAEVQLLNSDYKTTGRLLPVTLTWTGTSENPLPQARIGPASPVTVWGQISSVDENARKLQLFVLRAPRGEPGIQPGRTVLVDLRGAWDIWQPVLAFVRDSGLPIEFTADTGVRVTASTDADWDLLRWPVHALTKGVKVPDLPYANLLLVPGEENAPVYFRQWDKEQSEIRGGALRGSAKFKPQVRFVTAIMGDHKLAALPLLVAPNPENEDSKWDNFAYSDLSPEPPLLPDQFLVEDGIFTWFGDSVVVSGEGEASLPAAKSNPDSPPPEPQTFKLLNVEAKLPDFSLPELRVGHAYRFRLRAVYLCGTIPRGFCRNLAPDDAVFEFGAFGDYGTGTARRFLRLDVLAPPRVGWPFNKLGREEFAPGSERTGNVWNGIGALEFDEHAGTPTELHLYSDRREDAENSNDLDHLKRVRKVLLRPPEITVRQAERLGLFDAWMQISGDSDKALQRLYQRVIKPRDRVEVDVAEVEVVNADHTRKKEKRQRVTATPGLLLPRFSDADVDRPVFVLNGTRLNPVEAVKFASGQWPNWQDLFLEIRPPRKDWGDDDHNKDNLKLGGHPGTENDPIHLRIPPDADWLLEIHSHPTPAALSRLAIHRFLLLCPIEDVPSGVEMRDEQLLRIATGLHPAVSPPVTVRIRHFTNRPLLPPRLQTLVHVRPLPGKSLAELRGVYEFDRASTGTLLIQAATEIDWLDNEEAALPSLPEEAMRRLIFSESQELPLAGEAQRVAHLNSNFILGRSSDAVDRLDTIEHTVTELPLKSPATFNPKGEGKEQVVWIHDLGDRKHHTVFYRALAVSRFKGFFPEGKSETNPLSTLFSLADASARDAKAEKSRVRDPWDWCRVEIPATARPEQPQVREAPPVYQWDPPWDKDSRRWQHGLGGWTFVSTRTCGCRIWLERPWFSSGANEKLALLCWLKTKVAKREKDRYLRVVSRWGKDPIHYDSIRGFDNTMGLLTVDQVLSAEPLSKRYVPTLEPAPKKAKEDTALVHDDTELAGDLRVGIAVHTPYFHAQERAWFCDIFLRAPTYTPFAWLSVARYQPHALEGLALSRPVRLEHPVQIWPSRTLTVKLSAVGGQLIVTIRVTGERSQKIAHSLVCRVERLFEDSELVESKGPMEDVSELAETMAPPPIAEGANLWQSVTFLNENGDRVYEVEVPASGRTAQTEFRLARAHGWPMKPRLRLSFYESEEHFPAYRLPEGKSQASRPIYEEAIELPREVVALLSLDYSSTLPPN